MINKPILYYFLVLSMIFSKCIFANASYLTNANKNRKKYYQVPTDELIFGKIAAIEPIYIYEGKLRGKGLAEAQVDKMILKLRNSKIDLYVDYFTPAKSHFYYNQEGYEICSDFGVDLLGYRRKKKLLKKNNFQTGPKRFEVMSIPNQIDPGSSKIAIRTVLLKDFERHKFKETNVYNIRSIIMDEKLKTVQAKDMWSVIYNIIYGIQDHTQSNNLNPIFKKRVYEFVASNYIQLILMLQGKRMDYVDISVVDDFYIKKLGISENVITTIPISFDHPLNNLDKKEDGLDLAYIACSGPNLEKLKKVIGIINDVIKMTRTNEAFWEKTLVKFFKDVEMPYVSPQKYFATKFNFLNKKKIDSGYYDL